ncbi:hypothetical protein AAG570_002087 [Ranatra chinensis]|uniref:peptidylprolyl isomerase n=1 Tax=Ranatra chinensis TaxID=642074 RepID=A0ABD0YYN2_9HEMI
MPHVNLDCLQVESGESSFNTTPFDNFRDQMTKVTEDGGVRKKIIHEGVGSVVPPNGVVYIHYNSYLELEEVPFDTSYLRCTKPLRFQLGIGGLYPGFELSVLTMKKGEKSQFLIDHAYAFGKMGSPPRVPPNATLLVEIELLNFVDCGAIADEKLMTDDDRKKFAGAYKAALGFHALGNDYFKDNNIPAAVENYRKAETLLTGCVMHNDEEETQQKKLLMKIYVNLCICYNTPKMKAPGKVCLIAKDATLTSPTDARRNAKLHFNWGKALLALNDFKKAADHLKLALSLQPSSVEISEKLKTLEQKKIKYYEHEKISYKKALKLNSSQKAQTGTSKEPEFEKLIKSQLEEFCASSESSIRLPPRLTKDEKDLCRKLAHQLGLSFQEVVSDKCVISITK